MSCPTCDHTMEAVAPRLWWCPRCGTLKNERTFEPLLITRVKRFRDFCNVGTGLSAEQAHLWHRLGIAESIALPENRPTIA